MHEHQPGKLYSISVTTNGRSIWIKPESKEAKEFFKTHIYIPEKLIGMEALI